VATSWKSTVGVLLGTRKKKGRSPIPYRGKKKKKKPRLLLLSKRSKKRWSRGRFEAHRGGKKEKKSSRHLNIKAREVCGRCKEKKNRSPERRGERGKEGFFSISDSKKRKKGTDSTPLGSCVTPTSAEDDERQRKRERDFTLSYLHEEGKKKGGRGERRGRIISVYSY